MEVVLLERVEKLGQMGDVVKVRDGFARNFLLPRKKALRATKQNIEHFERERAQLEARNLELRQEAERLLESLDGKRFVMIRQAGETGQLYGSVSTRDIADALTEGGFSAHRNQVMLDRPIKTLGLHDVRIILHPEVSATVSLNVARNEDEAERQARGENVLLAEDEEEFELEEFFESEEVAREALAETEEDADLEAETAQSGADEAEEDETV